MTSTEPTEYPNSWRLRSAPPQPEPIDTQIDDYIRNLSARELQALLTRTRGGH